MSKPIVCFHIGRGGRFYNEGHLSFLRYEDNINKFTDDLFLYYEFEIEYRRKYKNYPNIVSALERFFESGQGEIDQYTMDEYPIFKRLGIALEDIGEYKYYTSGGHDVGLEYNNGGIGTIDIDGGYNTTYCKCIDDCDREELKLIIEDNPYNLVELLEEAGYNNVDVFEAFDLLIEMLDSDDLSYHDIEEITEDEFYEIGDDQEIRAVQGKFYKID